MAAESLAMAAGSVPVWSKAGMLLLGNSEDRTAWSLANAALLAGWA